MSVSLEDGTAIALAVLAAGRAEGAHALSVVVTDAGGYVRVSMRSDAAGLFGLDIALAKAVTALGFGRSSGQIARVFEANPAAVAGLSGATGGRFVALAGGVLVLGETGTPIGAVGVAGSLPQDDERLARAGIASAGLASQE